MLYSIIIPSYKRLYLREAIESVIAQTFKDFELIVIDDCSPENLQEIVAPYLRDERVRYVRNPHNYGAKRLTDNWNNALPLCKGEYVICMGDDDRLLPHCLEEYTQLIKLYPTVTIFHAQTEIIDEQGKVIEILQPRFEHENVLQLIYYRFGDSGRQQFIGDFCYKKEELMANGGFFSLPLAWGSDDISACMAASKAGIANTQKTCFQYRNSRHTITLSASNHIKVEALMLQKEWYERFLYNIVPKNHYDEILLQLLTSLVPIHFKKRIKSNIKQDMMKTHFNVLYWILNRKKYNLTIKEVSREFIKSFI